MVNKRNMYRIPYVLTLIFLFVVCNFENQRQVNGKKFMRCELARKLAENYGFSKTFLPSWICLIEHESQMDTSAIKVKPNGVENHGLFQIGSDGWCGKNRKGGMCNKKCQDFIDDNIDDDVACAKKIFDQDGFKHWYGWNTSCNANTRNLPNLGVLCNFHTFAQYKSFLYKTKAIRFQ